MKKSTQINGLPIINIADGNQVGKVKSLVINPDKGSVDFLTIDDEDWQVSVKAIPFKKVVGIGEYAVTIESENAVIDLNEIPIANQLVGKKIKIINNKVMTRKGELIGEVEEYFVDEDTGHILGMQLKVANKQVALSSSLVVTFGKDIIIVNEDATSHFLETVEQLEESNKEKADPQDEQTPVSGEPDLPHQDLKELQLKQIELLEGKQLLQDITAQNGEVLFRAGTILSKEDVKKAQQAGPEVVVDVSMNVKD